MRKLPWIWLSAWFLSAALLSSRTLEYDLSLLLEAPSLFHPFGRDVFGRDFLVIVLQSSLTSSAFALIAVSVSLLVGLVVGSAIAVLPTALRNLCLRVLEGVLSFPSLLFALAWAAIRGPGWDSLIFALFIGTLPPFIRLIYLRAREVMAEDFILSAKSLGAGSVRIARFHLMPAVFSLALVKTPNLFAYALMTEATVSFLGVGAPTGHDTWGSLLAQARDYLVEAPHLAVGAGLPLVLTILSLQVISEGFFSSKFMSFARR